ncbi:MAG TPA: DUF6064 family protein [Geminicoccus sp.]|jgi:hypothetical protein|uniref:DUF6064 family protein n=1 Tax=Geminicoccus sp. TaxID=2024832 RepID=UPI002E3050E1|nr:DUF6064 family protein [Geminicoccus sp.]HEX2529004.1 DUF6064 family protein [Geminicoccus sp.]
MSEWWTYGLSDFLLFSPRTYVRLIELYNLSIWPAQLAAVAAGVVILVLQLRAVRLAGLGLLGLCWLWIAWAWFGQRYATINWAASYAGLAFAAEGALLLAAAFLSRERSSEPWLVGTGIVLTLAGLFALPLLELLSGERGWKQVAIFGIMPDPTAIVTLGVLVPLGGRIARIALVVPLLWCMVAGATLLAMDGPGAWAAPLAGVVGIIAIVAHLWSTRRRGFIARPPT